jgi:hypothetical protein
VDGVVRIAKTRATSKLKAGDWAEVTITSADEYDLQATLRGTKT